MGFMDSSISHYKHTFLYSFIVPFCNFFLISSPTCNLALQDDSPIPSDDSNSETEQDNEDDQSERRGKSERSETGAKKVLTVPVSNHIKTGRASPTQSRDRSPENGGDRRAPAVKPVCLHY